ncbi:hypothetical protein ACN28E_52295 [Archangium lansingense]|uniref:hypothetical protein n=1 Tax=Archangium lansingense TaxID=2995310 RepID=UPI003B7DB5E5
MPAATRAGQVFGKAVQAAEVIQGFINVSKFLDEAQKERAEKIIVECVKEAHFKVEEELFGKGKTLPATDCKKPPTVEEEARSYLGPTPGQAQARSGIRMHPSAPCRGVSQQLFHRTALPKGRVHERPHAHR